MDWSDDTGEERWRNFDGSSTPADDAQIYPPAPIPAHERVWRHPSEVGLQAWTASEPPMGLGRGLSAATGTLGMILAGAVLWTLVPSAGTPSAGPSAATRQVNISGDTRAFFEVDIADSTSFSSPTASRPPQDEAPLASGPAEESNPTAISRSTVNAPVPTMQVERTTIVGDDSTPSVAPPVAVTFGDGALLLTTARAIGSATTISLMSPSGEPAAASIVAADGESGLVVLRLDTVEGPVTSIPLAVEPPTAGSSAIVMDTDGAPQPITLVSSDSGTLHLHTGGEPSGAGVVVTDVPEGSPVYDDSGALIGLCTIGPNGPELAALSNLPDLSTLDDSETAWLGVSVHDSIDGVVVTAVDDDGPAAVAGVQVGDVIVGVDDDVATSTKSLSALLGDRAAGTSVVLHLRRGDTVIALDVVLAARPSTL